MPATDALLTFVTMSLVNEGQHNLSGERGNGFFGELPSEGRWASEAGWLCDRSQLCHPFAVTWDKSLEPGLFGRIAATLKPPSERLSAAPRHLSQ